MADNPGAFGVDEEFWIRVRLRASRAAFRPVQDDGYCGVHALQISPRLARIRCRFAPAQHHPEGSSVLLRISIGR